MSDESCWWERLADRTPRERAELAAQLTAELPDDDPMIEVVRSLLGVAPDQCRGEVPPSE